MQQLVAKVDPENIPSEKIVVRTGASRGELLKGSYVRASGGARRDIRCFYIHRPIPGAGQNRDKHYQQGI